MFYDVSQVFFGSFSYYYRILIVTRLRGWTTEECWFDSHLGKGYFSTLNLPKLPRDSPTHTHAIRTRFLLTRVKWPGRDAGY